MRPASMIHPDHLHDRAQSGRSLFGETPTPALSPDEWQRFGAHLAACRACAWEKAATDDFAREARAGADDGALLDLVEGALARAGFGAPAEIVATEPRRSASRARPTPPPTRRARWTTALMVAAAMAAILLPGGPATLDTSRDQMESDGSGSLIATSDASLDAGANGTPSGGDS